MISWIYDFRIQDLDLVRQLQQISDIRASLDSIVSTLSDVGDEQFRADFERLHRYRQLKEELADAEFLTSEASLTHLPEYNMRVQVIVGSKLTPILLMTSKMSPKLPKR